MDNLAIMCGNIVDRPQLSHTIAGSDMYSCRMEIPRLSGVVDEIPLLFSSNFLGAMQGHVSLEGRLRGYTRQEQEKRRLHLMVLVKQIQSQTPPENNLVELHAQLYKEPIYRQTPLGREIADLLLRVPRERGGYDYIPSIVWGGCARFSRQLSVGDTLHVFGRMQSRLYTKQLDDGLFEEKTAFELSINRLNRV